MMISIHDFFNLDGLSDIIKVYANESVLNPTFYLATKILIIEELFQETIDYE